MSGGSGELVVETVASAHRLVGEVKVAPGDAVELRIVSLQAGVQANCCRSTASRVRRR
ncbi:MAG: hypothetical protein QF398_11690 [Alphaproteobacteria bacterium]|nr:hypothetical protein [Alphaproteobacteria bacterium]MDP6271027.1 hypothetical protein [Alphaproteobacteria bacterium]